MENINQNKLIVRYQNGEQIYIEPNLQEKLKKSVKHLKAGGQLQDLIKQIDNRNGGGIEKDSTWFYLIQEVLKVFERPPKGRTEREKAMLCFLEAICSYEKDREIWHAVKTITFKYADILSGWDYYKPTLYPQNEPIRRINGKYHIDSNDEICEILGVKTDKEERWDYIKNSCDSTYGAMHSLFKLVSLVNICLDFQKNPKRYPSSVMLVLPENGGTNFLDWKWHIKWPFRPHPINWRPDNNLCDPNWLISDFLCFFAEKEGISEKELAPAELMCPNQKWKEEFREYPRQLEFAIKTTLRFGDAEEVWFKFRGKTFRWINQNENRHTVLIVPVTKSNNYKEEYELAMRFLSRLAFDTEIPINIITSVEGRNQFQPRLFQPKRGGSMRYPANYQLQSAKFSSEKEDCAYAFYREGLSSSSVYYSFLNFYKVIQLAFDEKGEDIINWIKNSLNKISSHKDALERILEIKNKEEDIANYLFESGRCAIAHAAIKKGKGPVVDPDNPQDHQRLNKDLAIVKGLARYAIESGLFKVNK